jgi:hypothetical protein
VVPVVVGSTIVSVPSVVVVVLEVLVVVAVGSVSLPVDSVVVPVEVVDVMPPVVSLVEAVVVFEVWVVDAVVEPLVPTVSVALSEVAASSPAQATRSERVVRKVKLGAARRRVICSE